MDIRPTKRTLFQIIAGALSLPIAAKAATPQSGLHPVDTDPNRAMPERGRVAVTWTSLSGKQYTFNVDHQRDALIAKADFNGMTAGKTWRPGRVTYDV